MSYEYMKLIMLLNWLMFIYVVIKLSEKQEYLEYNREYKQSTYISRYSSMTVIFIILGIGMIGSENFYIEHKRELNISKSYFQQKQFYDIYSEIKKHIPYNKNVKVLNMDIELDPNRIISDFNLQLVSDYNHKKIIHSVRIGSESMYVPGGIKKEDFSEVKSDIVSSLGEYNEKILVDSEVFFKNLDKVYSEKYKQLAGENKAYTYICKTNIYKNSVVENEELERPNKLYNANGKDIRNNKDLLSGVNIVIGNIQNTNQATIEGKKPRRINENGYIEKDDITNYINVYYDVMNEMNI